MPIAILLLQLLLLFCSPQTLQVELNKKDIAKLEASTTTKVIGKEKLIKKALNKTKINNFLSLNLFTRKIVAIAKKIKINK